MQSSNFQKAGVTVRPAVASDVTRLHQALVAMATQAGDVGRLESSADDLLAHGFGESPAFEALIAEVGTDFAGLCITFPSFSTWRGRRGLYVQDLFVETRFRGLRIGEVLLRAVAARGQARGATYLRLSVDVSNLAAQRFYSRLGIHQSADEQVHVIRGEAFETLAAGAASVA